MTAADKESAFQGYAKAGQTEWIKNEIKWGTDYLLKTMKNNQENVTLVYQARPWAWPQNSTSGLADWPAELLMLTHERSPGSRGDEGCDLAFRWATSHQTYRSGAPPRT